MTHGIVCAAQPEAAEAGALALKAGGNAIDAAIACAITQGVVDPLMTGIGGVGSALVHDAKTGRTENINFLGVAPPQRAKTCGKTPSRVRRRMPSGSS